MISLPLGVTPGQVPRSPNPNLRIRGAVGAPLAPGIHGFGFMFSVMASYLSIADCDWLTERPTTARVQATPASLAIGTID